MMRGYRLLVSLLLAVFLVSTALPPGAAAAAEPTLTETEAVELLQEYGVVKGDPDGSLRLNDRLTRAQAAAIFVRALNYSEVADLLEDVAPFWDVQGHWGAGEITAAARLNLMKGDGDGRFRPDDEITYAEILTVLLRMVEQEPTGPWNPTAIMARAKNLNMAPSGVDASDRAIRGKVFWSLSTTITEVPLKDNSNLLNKHLDRVPPTLTVQRVTSPTSDESITLRGTASGAHKVTVNGKNASLDKRTGQFTASVSLDVGENTLVVEARDRAKNSRSETITVERRANISRLTVTGPSTIAARSEQKLEIKALDSRGNAVPLQGLTAKLSNDLATFDVKTHELTTKSTLGRSTLTLEAGSARATFTFEVQGPSDDVESLKIQSINGGRAPALNKEATVTVQVLDEDDRVVTDDNFRSVTLKASNLTGVTISPATAQTVKGVATFTIKGSREGTATLTASSSGLDSVTADVEFLGNTRVVLSSTTSSLRPDGASTATIKATLTDENGRSKSNDSGDDIEIELTESGTDGELVTDWIIIPRNRSTSTENASFRAGINPGTARISGEIISGQKYSVQSLALPIKGDMAGAKFDITYSPSAPKPGDNVTVTLRVLDDRNRLVTTGSYAFQIKLATTNDDPITKGFPADVQLKFRNSAYYPVDDGVKESSDDNDDYSVVGRTERGIAEMTLTYAKSGGVKITPVPVGGSYDAYTDDGKVGAASASTGMTAPSEEISFAGTASGLKLTADSSLGDDQPGAAVNRASTVTVRVRVVDKDGATIPNYRQTVTLTRTSEGDGVTEISGSNRKSTSDGEAEFTIKTTSTQGFDTYTASLGNWTSDPITVSVQKEKLEAPFVVTVRGVVRGTSGTEYFAGEVPPNADYMDIQLAPHPPADPSEPTNWVTAKVYRKGERTPFFTSEAIDLLNDIPYIRIPRSELKAGTYHYEVTVNNGAGDSARSQAVDSASEAKVADYSTSYKLTSAAYDAKTGELVLSGSGFASSGVVNLSKLSLVNGKEKLSLADAAVDSISSRSITLTLGALADEVTPERFHGSEVYVKADTGWYTNEDASLMAKAYPEVQVKPMAFISHGAMNWSEQLLYLHGEGFKQGTIDYDLIGITDGADTVRLNPGSRTTNDRVTSTADGQIILTLSDATMEALADLTDTELEVVAELGWLYTGSSSSRTSVGAVQAPIYTQVSMTRASYANGKITMRGSWPEGTSIDPELLIFKKTTSSKEWSPTRTDTVVATEANIIELVLQADDLADFLKEFKGGNVFMNTAEGWMTDNAGREVAPLNDYTILFSVR